MQEAVDFVIVGFICDLEHYRRNERVASVMKKFN